MDQTTQEGLRMLVDDLLLPWGEHYRPFVFVTGAVLRKQTRPMLPGSVYDAAARPTPEPRIIRGRRGPDRLNGRRALLHDLRITLVQGDLKAVDPIAPAYEVTVPEIHAE
jgi:hypothetical protein